MSAASPPRVVLFGGKGGVGKTTCASATALSLAQQDLQTLLVSTDPAHSTSDLFDATVGDEPTQLEDNLSAVEIDPKERFGRRYSEKLRGLLERANSLGLGIDEDDVTDVTANGLVPGVDELAVIDVFAEYVEDDTWDVVVFDTAPTGHTLRVLQLPDVAGSALSKAASLKSGVDRVTSVASRMFGNGSSSDDDLNVSRDVSRAQHQIETVSEIIEDPVRTRFNVVAQPEEMALAETKRLHEELADVGIPVGDTIVNRVRLDVDEDCTYCTAQQEKQFELLGSFEDETGVETHRIPATPALSDRERIGEIAADLPNSVVSGSPDEQ